MRVTFMANGLLRITKSRDKAIQNSVIPAQAGIQNPLRTAHGFPPARGRQTCLGIM
jgi:hypothetical protein